jgi:hypothetical protein
MKSHPEMDFSQCKFGWGRYKLIHNYYNFIFNPFLKPRSNLKITKKQLKINYNFTGYLLIKSEIYLLITINKNKFSLKENDKKYIPSFYFTLNFLYC